MITETTATGTTMKSNMTLHDKLIKQNEISRQRLAQELVKLEKVEKSDLRMIETTRHRFRSRRKKLESKQPSAGSNVRSPESRENATIISAFRFVPFPRHCSGDPTETRARSLDA